MKGCDKDYEEIVLSMRFKNYTVLDGALVERKDRKDG